MGNLLPAGAGAKPVAAVDGTGVAPFGSILRDEHLPKSDQIFLTHTCRKVADLQYSEQLAQTVYEDPLYDEYAAKQFHYYNSVTRPRPPPARADHGLDPRVSSLMISAAPGLDPERPGHACGSMESGAKAMLEEAGLRQTSGRNIGEYVLEKAFVG